MKISIKELNKDMLNHKEIKFSKRAKLMAPRMS
jgi:hypothetical protein